MSCSEPPFDAAAFGELVDRHHPMLYAFARRRVAEQASIEDVLADTFLVAWRRRAEIPYRHCRGSTAFACGRFRRTGDPAVVGPGCGAVCRPVPEVAGRDPADLHATRSEINWAFAQLSESERETLRLIAWDGLSTEDAATVLGITPGAFRVRLHRARRALEKHLGADGHEQVMTGRANEAQVESSQ